MDSPAGVKKWLPPPVGPNHSHSIFAYPAVGDIPRSTPFGHRMQQATRFITCMGAVLQGLGFAMLKRTGKGGMAPFKGSGFVTGRTVNARRETEWSAPTYFDMTIYGLGPPFRGEETLSASHPWQFGLALSYAGSSRSTSIMLCYAALLAACQIARAACIAEIAFHRLHTARGQRRHFEETSYERQQSSQ